MSPPVSRRLPAAASRRGGEVFREEQARRGATASVRAGSGNRPRVPCSSRRREPSGNEAPGSQMVGEGHAPVVAVLVAAVKKKPDESIRTPKDVNHGPQAFSPAKQRFPGTAGGGHHRHLGPPASRRRDGGWARAMPPLGQYLSSLLASRKGPSSPSWTPGKPTAVMVGEGRAPVVPVLLSCVKAADPRP